MRISRRESLLLLVTCVAGLYGGTAMLARPRLEEWKSLTQQQDETREDIELDQRLIASREHWAEEFGGLSKLLPRYPADKKMDIYWLAIMDNAAVRHGVKILKRQAGEEKQVGDVYELPIECKDWEADLDGIVHFLFDLQTQTGMLDIRQLYIKPAKGGVLRGRFTMYCAYIRDVAPKEDDDSPES